MSGQSELIEGQSERLREAFRQGAWLLVEGALRPPAVGLLADGQFEHEVLSDAPRARGDLVGAAIRLLDRRKLKPAELGGFVAGTGPGSFTGVRVALSAVEGFRLGGARNLQQAGLARAADASSDPGAAGSSSADGSVRSVQRVFGADSARILAEAAGQALPAWVAIPWGRLRVLLVQRLAESPYFAGARLMPKEELAALVPSKMFEENREAAIVMPAALENVALAAGIARRLASATPIEALARLALKAELTEATVDRAPGARLSPTYLVPPDAVLPLRASRRSGTRFVSLGLGDAQRVETFARTAFAETWSRKMIEEELDRPSSRRLTLGVCADAQHNRGSGSPGASRAGALDAVLFARQVVDLVWLLQIAVHPDSRRKGHARALLAELVNWAREKKVARIELEVAEDNLAAIALYETSGFVPVGRRPNYYKGGRAALLMSLNL